MKSEKDRRTHKKPVTLSAPPHLAISASNAACTVLLVKSLDLRSLHPHQKTSKWTPDITQQKAQRHQDVEIWRQCDVKKEER